MPNFQPSNGFQPIGGPAFGGIVPTAVTPNTPIGSAMPPGGQGAVPGGIQNGTISGPNYTPSTISGTGSGILNAIGSGLSASGSTGLGGIISSLGSIGGSVTQGLGAANAASAQTSGINAGIGAMNSGLTNANQINSPYLQTGANATGVINNLIGNNQTPANYSSFYNSPGFQWQTGLAKNTINNQAAAAGNLYSPTTLNNVGMNIAGLAGTQYQNYMQNLLSSAGLGAGIAPYSSQQQVTTGTNIGEADSAIGAANASGVAGVAGAATGSNMNPFSSLFGGSGTGSNPFSSLGNSISNYFNPLSPNNLGDNGASAANSMYNNTVPGMNTAANNPDFSFQGNPDFSSGLDFSGASNYIPTDYGTMSSVAGAASDALSPVSLGTDTSLLSNFSSAGGQAAAAGTDALTAVPGASDLGMSTMSGSVGSTIGSAAGYVAAPLAIYNAAADWQQGNTLGNTLNSAEAGAAIGSIIPGVGTLVGGIVGGVVGGVTSLIQGPHTMENVTNANAPGDQTIKLQSGNSALLNTQTGQGGIAFGAGSSRGQGSGQWFLNPAQTGTLDYNAQTGTQNYSATNGDPTATKGSPYWLGTTGSQMLTSFANTIPLTNGQPDFSKYISQYNSNPTSGTGIIGIYNNSGGQDMWGETFPQWLQSVYYAKNGVTGNLST